MPNDFGFMLFFFTLRLEQLILYSCTHAAISQPMQESKEKLARSTEAHNVTSCFFEHCCPQAKLCTDLSWRKKLCRISTQTTGPVLIRCESWGDATASCALRHGTAGHSQYQQNILDHGAHDPWARTVP